MDVERLSAGELERIQERKLKVLVHYVYSNSSFYRKRFKEAGINPWDFAGLKDLEKLPFTRKQDLRDKYPTGMFAVPLSEVVRYHASSGTTSKPTVVGYTARDLETWAECLARGLASCGLTEKDIMQISYGYGLFTGGFGFHYAAEKLGVAVIPASTGNTRRQLELMRDLKTTAIACTPSYMLHLAENMKGMLDEINLRMGFFGAEPWSEETRKRIEAKTGIDAFDCYGSSELSGPLFTECREKAGFHVWADHFLIEIINPETGEQVGEGEKGELVVTTLSKEALPLIRWRTGDITHIDSERCACGRTHPRVVRITGRSDDILIVRGVNVFPSQIEHVLMEIPELAEHYMIFLERKKGLDVMKIQVELRNENNLDTDFLRKKVAKRLKSVLNLTTEVEIVSPGRLQRFEGKARRVVDRRKF